MTDPTAPASVPKRETAGRPEVVVIAAVAEAPGTDADRLIGDGLELPWHLPTDFRRFKRLTTGHPLVMGRKTYESLLHQNGGPLPNRANVVLTRDRARLGAEADCPDLHIVGSLDEAVGLFPKAERVFIGGGAGVYGAVLEDGLADRLELTLVEGTFSGDTFFPPYRHLLAANGGPYRLASREAHPATDGRPAFRFETYVRADASRGATGSARGDG
ncbi:MAG: dihydrofolate reductase [Bacteroidota bacterium]